jgi:hypothetical protein
MTVQVHKEPGISISSYVLESTKGFLEVFIEREIGSPLLC